jgi:hypothetical protein
MHQNLEFANRSVCETAETEKATRPLKRTGRLLDEISIPQTAGSPQ